MEDPNEAIKEEYNLFALKVEELKGQSRVWQKENEELERSLAKRRTHIKELLEAEEAAVAKYTDTSAKLASVEANYSTKSEELRQAMDKLSETTKQHKQLLEELEAMRKEVELSKIEIRKSEESLLKREKIVEANEASINDLKEELSLQKRLLDRRQSILNQKMEAENYGN